MYKGLRIPGILCLLLWLGACTSSGSVQMTHAKTSPIPSGSTVALEVVANLSDDADGDARADASETIHRLKARLFGRLVSEAIFRQVLQPGEEADYNMNVTLLNAEEISQSARILFGALAGSNTLSARVTLHNAESDELVTEFEVGGESASHPFSSENDLDDAVREAVDEIIMALR